MVFIRSLSRQLRRPFLSGFKATPFARASPFSISGARTLTATANLQGKVLLVLYDVSASLQQFYNNR
jgi:formate dehydrogenase